MSLIDDLSVWLTSGPGAPLFAQVFSSAHTVQKDFATESTFDPASAFAGLRVQLAADEDLRAPSNGMLQRVPDIATLSDEEFDVFRANWPALRGGGGQPFGPHSDALQQDDLLLEVWGGAHRRYEYLWVSLDFSEAQDVDSERRPQMPVPRWFWIRGIASADIDTAIGAIVASQYTGVPYPAPTLESFAKGRTRIYVGCGDTLGHVATGQTVEVRAFDATGLPIDPAFVFAQFARLAAQGFGRLARPDAASVSAWESAWSAALPPRQTLVFCDHRGKPYVPWEDVDPPPHPPEPPVPAPERRMSIPDKSIEAEIPAFGVVVFANGSAEHSALRDQVVDLTVAGEHTRVGLYPHGRLGASASAGFPAWSFFRVQVADYARWFPRNANDRNQMQRYSEGNHYQYLIDGRATFREMYRDFRATHRDEEYLRDDDMPEGVARPDAEIAGTQILVINAWISAGLPLLGRRAMLATQRMQRGERPPENLPARWIAKPCFEFPASPTPRPSSEDNLQRLYWLVFPAETLEPGTHVELRQLSFSSRFRADDPRLVGEDAGADMYGRLDVVKDASSWAFASPSGACVLRAVFDPDWDGEALLRATTWKPDDEDPGPLDTATTGRGTMRVWAYGTVDLPAAPGGLSPPPPAGVDVDVTAQLLWNGAIGEATVFLPAGLVTAAPATAVVVNQRTGEAVSALVATTNVDVEIPLANFARDDSALLGFTTATPASLADCPGFFELRASDAQKTDGLAPQHPKEVGGLLREAVQAGVDVRLLAWNDQFKTEGLLDYSLGVVSALNPPIDGRRGQAMLDRITRETGVHHQKSTFVRTPAGGIAFVGGIDLGTGRFDEELHPEPNADRPNDLRHDVHCRIVGRAAWDVYRNFQERWNIARSHPELQPAPAHATALPPPSETEILSSLSDGPHAVQITRTIPPYIDAYTPIVDLDRGDRSALQSYERSISQARQFLYIEEQYLWNPRMAQAIRDRLVDLVDGIEWAIIILPRKLSEFATLDLVFYAMRRRCINIILYGTETAPAVPDPSVLPGYVGHRVIIAHPVEANGRPVYVHTKSIVADDVWMTIGSSNMSRRSTNLDTEINAAAIDARIRRGASMTPREYRVALMAEHLRLLPEERPLLDDPRAGFRLFKSAMAGERPWMRIGLIPYDPLHTQYGHQPPDFDPYFPDALAAGMDPDGDSRQEIRLVDFLTLRQTFAEASDPSTFGNVSALRAAADVSALPALDPSLDRYQWIVELFDTADPASPVRTVGPIPVADAAALGIVSNTATWRMRGAVARASAPATVVSSAQAEVTPTQLVTSVTLAFLP